MKHFIAHKVYYILICLALDLGLNLLQCNVNLILSLHLCSVSVFGVSAESMQCAYDTKGNSVPFILLLMQERLYSQEGLKVRIC